MWGKKRARKRIKAQESGNVERIENTILNGAARLREELNFRLICEFCGVPCMGEEDRKELLGLAKAGGNFPLWRELNLPGKVLQVESIHVAGIVWPTAKPVEKGKRRRLKNVLSALLSLLYGKRKKAG